jgi:hypothetical protein
MREGIAAAEAEPFPDPALFEHAFVDPPASFQRSRGAPEDPAELDRRGDQRRSRRAARDATCSTGEDVGRAGGVFRATAVARPLQGDRWS